MGNQRDHIPEGCMPLDEAFKRHFLGKFGYVTELEVGQLNDDHASLLKEMVHAFIHGELVAHYRMPAQTETYEVARQQWADQFNAERVFLAGIILASKGDPMFNLDGRYPFTNRRQFESWSRRKNYTAMQGQEGDPMVRDRWWIGEVLAWIVWRDASVFALFNGDNAYFQGYFQTLSDHEGRTEDASTTSVSGAFEQLIQRCESGVLKATAVRKIADGLAEPCIIPAHAWAHLEPYDTDISEIGEAENSLNVEGQSGPAYVSVKFNREDILAEWKPARRETTRRTKQYPKAKVAALFLKHVKLWKAGKAPQLTWRKWHDAGGVAETAFPRIRVAQCTEIWEEHAPPEWKKTGPKDG